jgi:hypothetical protein
MLSKIDIYLHEFAEVSSPEMTVMDLSLSEAKAALWGLNKEGVLQKRGFRFRMKWVSRFFVLRGRMLMYYDLEKCKTKSNIRHSIKSIPTPANMFGEIKSEGYLPPPNQSPRAQLELSAATKGRSFVFTDIQHWT